MASEIEVYDLSNYLDYNKELGIHDTQSGDFVDKLRDLPVDKIININNELLDEISNKVYNTEQLWWVIGIYNSILDPMNITPQTINIPSLSEIENLFLDSIEEQNGG